jgi:hypothetical protein
VPSLRRSGLVSGAGLTGLWFHVLTSSTVFFSEVARSAPFSPLSMALGLLFATVSAAFVDVSDFIHPTSFTAGFVLLSRFHFGG